MAVTSTLWDVKSLIEHKAGVSFKRHACSNGIVEYCGPCPFPECSGSKDSFVVRPETGKWTHGLRTGGCGRSGDMLDFLEQFSGMTKREGIDFLGLQGTDFERLAPPTPLVSMSERPPCKEWQEQASILIAKAERALWGSQGKEMLAYLRGRGLKDETIEEAHLGYVPLQGDGRYYTAPLVDWGLDPEKEAKKVVTIPNGILIPYFEGETIWRLAMRRPGQSPDKGVVLGSGKGLYNVDSLAIDKPVMMVESELCALSVHQEAGDLIACVATGGTKGAQIIRWVTKLSLASFMLQSFDEDAPESLIHVSSDKRGAGDEGAEYWLRMEGSMRWSPLIAKDPNDLLQGKFFPWVTEGFTVREWAQAGIDTHKQEHTPREENKPIIPPVVEVMPGPVTVPPLHREEPILVYEKTGDMRETILAEYRAKGLTPLAMPSPPSGNVCPNHDRTKWFYSETVGEWACRDCLVEAYNERGKRKEKKPMAKCSW